MRDNIIDRSQRENMRDSDDSRAPGQALIVGAFAFTRKTIELADRYKIRVIETASRVRLAFAAACPDADLFRSLANALISPTHRSRKRHDPRGVDVLAARKSSTIARALRSATSRPFPGMGSP
jgi:hypothetical protein